MTHAARTKRSLLTHLVAAVIACAATNGSALGQFISDKLPEQAQGLAINNRLGQTVPSNIELIDTNGKKVTLGERFGNDKPILVTMAYYDCPVLCPLTMNQFVQAFNALDYTVGKDFDLVVVSFDPTNTTAQALEEREKMLASLTSDASHEVMRGGLGFYTADEANAKLLADSIGFTYKYVQDIDEYSHVSALMVLSPEGVLSHVFPNYTFRDPDSGKPVRDLKLAMLKASEGGIATSIADLLLNFCYSYDPTKGYTFAIMRVTRVIGVLTVVGLCVLIGGLRLKEVRRLKGAGQGSNDSKSKTNEGQGVGAEPIVH